MNKKVALLLLVIGLVIGGQQAHAASYFSSDDKNILNIMPTDSKPVYAAGGDVTLSTKAGSDFIVAGNAININAEVAASIFAAGGRITVTAPIAKSARISSQTTTIRSEIGEDLSVVTGDMAIEKGSVVRGDVHVAGAHVVIDGHINGSVFAMSRDLIINGIVDGDIKASVGSLTISDTAQVTGKLTYWSADEAVIAAGVVKGPIDWKQSRLYASTQNQPFSILASLVIGLLLMWLFRYKIERVASDVMKHALTKAGYGLLFLVVVPIAVVLLAITIIGLPIAAIVFGFYFLMLASLSTLASFIVGERILRITKLQPSPKYRMLLALIVGVLVMSLLNYVPYVGGLAKGVISLVVLGAFLHEDYVIWEKLRKERTI